MKKVNYILLLLLLVGCNSNTVMVWNWRDVIGFSILGLLISVAIIAFVFVWVKSKINKWRDK